MKEKTDRRTNQQRDGEQTDAQIGKQRQIQEKTGRRMDGQKDRQIEILDVIYFALHPQH